VIPVRTVSRLRRQKAALGAVMAKIKLIVGLAVLVVAIMGGGQVGLAEWTNLRFQDDLRDISSSLGTRVGMMAPKNDDDLRNLVIRKAGEHGIALAPAQVTVRHPASAELVFLAAEYDVTVSLPWYSFTLHFAPESTKKVF
jgi:hypothetical protein